mgnify:FL=1
MIRCTRCNRKLKAPTVSGMGETCERYVLGPRQRQAAQPKPARVRRDDATPDLFDGFGWPMLVAA